MLKILPCLDSDEIAAARRQDLDIPRNRAAALGKSAVQATDIGHYASDDGVKVDWARYVRDASSAKVSIPPDANLPATVSPSFLKQRFRSPTKPPLELRKGLLIRASVLLL